MFEIPLSLIMQGNVNSYNRDQSSNQPIPFNNGIKIHGGHFLIVH